jgi:hypothetical protein
VLKSGLVTITALHYDPAADDQANESNQMRRVAKRHHGALKKRRNGCLNALKYAGKVVASFTVLGDCYLPYFWRSHGISPGLAATRFGSILGASVVDDVGAYVCVPARSIRMVDMDCGAGKV